MYLRNVHPLAKRAQSNVEASIPAVTGLRETLLGPGLKPRKTVWKFVDGYESLSSSPALTSVCGNSFLRK